MTNKIHNITTWFVNKKTMDFYNNEFDRNLCGKFKIPREILEQNLRDGSIKNINKFLNKISDSIFNIAISSIVNSTPAKIILQKIPFSWLEKDTIYYLRQAACEIVFNLSVNNNFWEKTNASNISNSTFSMHTDITSWLINDDIISMHAKNLINLSGITEYEISENNIWYYDKNNGTIHIVGKIDDSLKELK